MADPPPLITAYLRKRADLVRFERRASEIRPAD
jgi:hypothetical protein